MKRPGNEEELGRQWQLGNMKTEGSVWSCSICTTMSGIGFEHGEGTSFTGLVGAQWDGTKYGSNDGRK